MNEIYEEISKIDGRLGPADYLKKILETLCERLGCEAGAIFERGPDQTLSVISEYNAPRDIHSSFLFEATPPAIDIEGNPGAPAFITGSGLSEKSAQAASFQGTLEQNGITGVLSMQFVTNGQAAGCCALYKKDGSVVQPDEISLFKTIRPLITMAASRNGFFNALNDRTTALETEIAGRNQVEEKLIEEKEKLLVMLSSIGDGIIAVDGALKILIMNGKAEKITGWGAREASGRHIKEVFNIVDATSGAPCENPVEKTLKTHETVGLIHNTVIISRNKDEKFLSASSAPILDKTGAISGAILVFRDITDRKILEEELLKVSKLESIGILAGGIAHDFNNLLTGIIGNITYAKMILSPGDKAFEVLTKAEDVAFRAKDLTSQFRTFSKGGTPIKKTIFINELIVNSFEFAARGSKVRCEFNIADDLYPVEVDEGQINQVVTNLVINSIEATQDNGLVKVSAENVYIEQNIAIPLKIGKYVRISVKDNGAGISPENMHRIFDPYFTTKSKGSGLGLTTSYSIIRKHDGTISVESEYGKGATFHVYLPVSSKEMFAGKALETVKPCPKKYKVMIMDDESIVREITSQLLSHLGYNVNVARDGKEAIELYGNAMKTNNGFDAVILDLVVPGGQGGVETLTKLIEMDPECRAIIASGYSNDHVMSSFTQYGFKGVISKPYRIKELDELIQKVIMNGKNNL